MNADDICFLPISELSAQIAAGELSPVELTEAYLRRVETLQPVLNAFINVTADRAMDSAREAETIITKRGPRSALHGIPLAHKDIVDVGGIPTTCGSEVLADNVPSQDAAVIARLDAVGAVLLGKLNMNEFATILPSDRFGPVKNPWHFEHSPGGSSSGSGVAVAAGLCAGALGTDTGGSIRLPATFCGISGLKATHGRISTRGVVPLAWSLDHIGPMTRSALDASIIFDAIAGYDHEDLTSRDRELVSASGLTEAELADLSDLKIAVTGNFLTEFSDPVVIRALDAAVEVLRELGARIEIVDLEASNEAWPIAEPIIQAEATTWHASHLDNHPELYGPNVRKFLERGRWIGAQAYVKARGEKAQFKRNLLTLLDPFDALIAPGALIPAPRLGARTLELRGKQVGMLPAVVGATCPFNLTGQPALSLPTGHTETGLPLGMQVATHRWHEHVALRIGQAYQAQTQWHLERPRAL